MITAHTIGLDLCHSRRTLRRAIFALALFSTSYFAPSVMAVNCDDPFDPFTTCNNCASTSQFYQANCAGSSSSSSNPVIGECTVDQVQCGSTCCAYGQHCSQNGVYCCLASATILCGASSCCTPETEYCADSSNAGQCCPHGTVLENGVCSNGSSSSNGNSSSSPPTVGCSAGTNFRGMVRATRRNQGNIFGPNSAPVCSAQESQWGGAYESGHTAGDFGQWSDYASFRMRNRSVGGISFHTGKPALLQYSNTWLQVNDPISPPVQAASVTRGTGKTTSLLKAGSIFTANGYQDAGQGVGIQWPVTVTAGPFVKQAMVLTPEKATGTANWDTFPSKMSPPCACTASSGLCDTDLSAPLIPPPGDVAPITNYKTGADPADRVLPYVVFDTSSLRTSGSYWGFVEGRVADKSGTGLAGIPVGITGNGVSPVEKITGTGGTFKILVDGPGPLTLTFNSKAPTPGTAVDVYSHFYNPLYLSQTMPLTTGWSVFGQSSQLGTITLANRPTDAENNLAAGRIEGFVESTEKSEALPNINVALRDQSGTVIDVAKTVSNGKFTLRAPLGKTYYVNVVGDSRWAVSPNSMKVLDNDFVTDPHAIGTFKVSGVPVPITVQTNISGSFVYLSLTRPTGSAPRISHRSGQTVNAFTATSGTDLRAFLSVPYQSTYWLTCWDPPAFKGDTFHRKAPIQIAPVGPGIPLSLACSPSDG